MTKGEAFELLKTSSLDSRLRAARFLEKEALAADVPQLHLALQSETVSWVRDSLERAIQRTRLGASFVEEEQPADDLSPSYQDMLIRATQEVTGAIVHELEPILGLLKIAAAEEVPNYAGSKTQVRIERLEALAVAVSNLRRASQSPSIQEFGLGDAIRTTVAEIGDTGIVLAGSNEIVVSGDRGLVCIALANALRNAVEATPEEDRANRPIVVNWGKTDKDAWITVIDQGKGISELPEVLVKIGTSTKESHFGMGLAIANTALLSLGGAITLKAGSPGGARFEARWPQGGERGGGR